MDERIGESIFQWFGHRKEWGIIGLLKGYMLECVDSHLVGRPRKRWINSVKEVLKEKKV